MLGRLIYIGFQGVDINFDKDILKIEDRRLIKHSWFVLIVLGIAFVVGYPLYQYLSTFWNRLAVAVAIIVVVLIVCAVRLSQISYRRIYSFDKKQGIYRLIEVFPFRVNENAGKLENIKKVQTDVYRHDSDGANADYYTYQTFLILDDFLAYDGSNTVAVGEESKNESTAAEIAMAISDFLQIPFSEERHF